MLYTFTVIHLIFLPTIVEAGLPSKLVDERCQVRFLVTLVDSAVRSWHSTYGPRSHKWTFGLKTYNHNSHNHLIFPIILMERCRIT